MKRSIKAALFAVLMPIGLLPAMPATGEGGQAREALVADVIRQNFNRVGGNNTSSGGHIVFEGDRLYMGTYGTGMRWFDISNPRSPVLLGRYEPGTTVSPRADAVPDAAVWDGRHIAVLNGTGRSTAPIASLNTQKAEFVDTTNPASPVLLHVFSGPSQNNDAESHNGDFFDAKRYWLPSGGGSGSIKDAGLRIYDMQPVLDNPPDPTSTNPANDPVRLFPPDACWTDAAILCDPVTLWRDSPHRGDQPVGPEPFSHTHDITIYPSYPVQQADGTFANRDIILLAEGGNYTNNAGNTGSVFVIDITDPRNPVVLQRWLHQTGPGHHGIRYHHEAIFIEGKPNLMVVSDEDLHNGCGTAGGLTAVQLSPDLKSGVEQSEWFIPSGTPAAICSAHVFSNAGNILFMGAYNAGTLAIDYSDPTNPTRVGHYLKKGGDSWGAYYNPDDGYVYQGDWQTGLDVLEFLGPIPGLPSGSQPVRTCPGRASSPLPQVVGTEKADVLVGGSGNEIICGMGGRDTIRGGGGRDLILGGAGKDRMNGGKGNDRIKGQGSLDRLRGGPGRDKCIGGPGRDRGKCEKGKL